MQIFGSDAQGNSLLVNISTGKDGTAEVWLILRLKDKGVYTLPGIRAAYRNFGR